ncbi:uncharacterized protein LOC122312999 [Carya illinoinensis]|uniref:Uncharacterized protein n=2 Tax=Carya illinoinensis TaxID=32201 RepID=A0A922EDI4_CARIL|nr:uncharacterized protein LOC122312999 [Carya illinoinensis]KAG6700632.1 hypothetical protein I3842_08G121600 [Carya illinoinensis]
MDLNKLYLNAPHSMGTTIIGVTYNGGVVLGADSRTSTGEDSIGLGISSPRARTMLEEEGFGAFYKLPFQSNSWHTYRRGKLVCRRGKIRRNETLVFQNCNLL